MKKIMIMTGSYYPKPMANGICVHQIALALKNYGYEVHVICFNKKGDVKEDKFEGIFVHRIKMRLFFKMRFYAEDIINTWQGKIIYKIAMLLNKFKRILYLPLYPMTSPLFIYRYFAKSKKLHEKYDFDMILSVYNPLEALVAGAMMKNRYKNIKLGLYVLDSLTNGSKKQYLPQSWTEKKGWEWEQRLYKISDVIFNMKCHEEHHKKERYDKYRGKMEIVDIPLFSEINDVKIECDRHVDDEHLNWVYTGTLSLESRNPEYLCKIFINLSTEFDHKLNFYSRGDSESLIKLYEEKSNGSIIRHGYVDRSEVLSAINRSEILISIGNQNSDMIPSKIFEYIATGKKIIHFYTRKNDSCIPYYGNYPNALLINENKNFEENIKKIKNFIIADKVNIQYIDIKSNYIKNTPSYTAEIIDNLIKR